MQLTPDYLISDCGCPQVINAIEYPANLKENCFSSAKLRFHNYVTSSRRRLLTRRESLSDYYDKLLMTSTAPMIKTQMGASTDFTKRQIPMEGDTLKYMKCAKNEAIRKTNNTQSSRSQQSANNVETKKKQHR